MGRVNTYLEYNNSQTYPINRAIFTYFSSSSSSYEAGATWTVPTNTSQTRPTSKSSTSGSRFGGTWYTMDASNNYTSSTSTRSDENEGGSQTVTVIPVSRTNFSAVESNGSFAQSRRVDTVVTEFFGTKTQETTNISDGETVTITATIDRKPYPISHTDEPRQKVTKTLVTKSLPYWLTVQTNTIIEGLNVFTTTTTSEHTYDFKTYDSSLTDQKDFKYVGYGNGGEQSENRLPNIIVGAIADAYSYQILVPKTGAISGVLSKVFQEITGSVNTVTVDFEIKKHDVKVYTNETKTDGSTVVDYERKGKHSTKDNIVFITQKIWDTTGSSYFPEDYLRFNIGSKQKTLYGGPEATTTVPATINDGYYFPYTQLRLINSSTSYTYLQNKATKTIYFSEIYRSTSGIGSIPYRTTTIDTITLSTRNLITATGSTLTEAITSGRSTVSYSSTGETSAEMSGKEYFHTFALREEVDIFFVGGFFNLPVKVWCKKYNEGYLGFAGTYDKSDLSTINAYRSIKVIKQGSPFGDSNNSFNIYDHTSLFALARKDGTVIFWPDLYQTYKNFTVSATRNTGKLKTSADLSVIYSTTTQETKRIVTTTTDTYSYTRLTKTRNNTQVNTGSSPVFVSYSKLTTTNTLVDSVTKTTVTYTFQLDSSVNTTGFYSYDAKTFGIPRKSPIPYNGPPVWVYRENMSRGWLGEVGGYSETTIMFAGSFSVNYTLIKSDGQTETDSKFFTDPQNTEGKFSTLNENERMYLEVYRLYSTYPVTANTRAPLFELGRYVKTYNGFTFL